MIILELDSEEKKKENKNPLVIWAALFPLRKWLTWEAGTNTAFSQSTGIVTACRHSPASWQIRSMLLPKQEMCNEQKPRGARRRGGLENTGWQSLSHVLRIPLLGNEWAGPIFSEGRSPLLAWSWHFAVSCQLPGNASLAETPGSHGFLGQQPAGWVCVGLQLLKGRLPKTLFQVEVKKTRLL